MKVLSHKDMICTGESWSRTPPQLRIQMNNQKISEKTGGIFLWFLVKEKGLVCFKETGLFFSSRQTRRRWGTANSGTNRITLYRHSAWMLLHELAHIPVGVEKGHGWEFGETLDILAKVWLSEEWQVILEAVKGGDF